MGRSVGWLGTTHPFSRGVVSETFIKRLIEICKKPAVTHRGFHVCEFCEANDIEALDYERAKTAGTLSWTLIRVIGRDGTLYYSPGMICHYVTEHGYQPPDEFVTAVMQTDLPDLK